LTSESTGILLIIWVSPDTNEFWLRKSSAFVAVYWTLLSIPVADLGEGPFEKEKKRKKEE